MRARFSLLIAIMKVCYANEMRKIDATAIEKYGIPGVVLMENAALTCVREIECFENIAVFCGKGNNGGDGFAIARHLFNKRKNVTVFLVCGEEFKGDAKINYQIIKNIGVKIIELTEINDFRFIKEYDVVVDAVYGTGIHGEIKGIGAEVIRAINKYSKYTLSVDIPSGIDADTGEICSVAVKADKTVTFAAYKTGLLMYPGADFAGDVTVADISIPESVLNELNLNREVITKKFFTDNFPKRENNSQKGNYGKVLVIAGSRGMSGAAYLSSHSAMLSGSGLVTLAVPESLNSALEAKTTEVMTLPLAENDGHLSYMAIDKIKEKAEKSDAILIGPGLGVNEECEKIVADVLKNTHKTVIIDADAINCIAKNMNVLKERTCDVILTPHVVEFSRMTGLSIGEIEKDRLGVSKDFSEGYGVTLILKGPHTVVTGFDQRQYINITGNSGLATGGSGDVLAGIVASYAARGIKAPIAAAMAVYIHGVCGDIAAQIYGKEAMLASNVSECVSKAYNHILQVEK